MRTTINIEDDLYRIARSRAESRGVSVGRAVSELMRKGLESDRVGYEEKNGLPVMSVSEDAPPITPEDVRRIEDEPS